MSNLNGYNPTPDGIATRWDAGVDYTSPHFAAMFDMKVLISLAWSPGWAPRNTQPFTDAAGNHHGDGYMALEIVQDCPWNGLVVYYAEGIQPVVSAGAIVKGGDIIAGSIYSLWNNVKGNCEIGWAGGVFHAGMPEAHLLVNYSGDQSPQAIACAGSFDHLVTMFGGPAGHNNTGLAPNYSLLPPEYNPTLWPKPRTDGFPLRQGEHGARVIEAQKALDHRGFSLATDGNYGPATAGAVALWQRVHGRTQTGTISVNDWAYMFPRLSIQTGNTWPGATQALQNALNAHGYSLTEDGIFGKATEGAISQFKAQHGLVADGICGPKTWRVVV